MVFFHWNDRFLENWIFWRYVAPTQSWPIRSFQYLLSDHIEKGCLFPNRTLFRHVICINYVEHGTEMSGYYSASMVIYTCIRQRIGSAATSAPTVSSSSATCNFLYPSIICGWIDCFQPAKVYRTFQQSNPYPYTLLQTDETQTLNERARQLALTPTTSYPALPKDFHLPHKQAFLSEFRKWRSRVEQRELLSARTRWNKAKVRNAHWKRLHWKELQADTPSALLLVRPVPIHLKENIVHVLSFSSAVDRFLDAP